MVLAAYDNTGATLVTVGPRDNIFKAWNVTDKSLSHSHTHTVAYSAVCIGSSAAASGSQEGGKKKKKVASGDKPILVFGTQNGGVQIWDLLSMNKLADAKPFQTAVTHVCVHPTRKSVFACAGEEGQVVELSICDGKQVDSFVADKGSVSAMTMSKDGQYLITAGVSKIRVWSLIESPVRCVGKFVPPLNIVKSVAIDGDNKFVCACDDSTSVHVYDLSKMEGKKSSAAIVINSHERIVRCYHAPKTDKLPMTVYCATADGNVLAYAIRDDRASLISTVTAGAGKVPTRSECVFAIHPLSGASMQVARGTGAGPTFAFVDLRQDGPVLGAPDRLKDVTLAGVSSSENTNESDVKNVKMTDVENFNEPRGARPKVLGDKTIGKVKPAAQTKGSKAVSVGLEFSDSAENLAVDQKLKGLIKSLPRLGEQAESFVSLEEVHEQQVKLVKKIVSLPDFKEGKYMMKLLVGSSKALAMRLVKQLTSDDVAELLRKMLLCKHHSLPMLNERIMYFFRSAVDAHGSNLASNKIFMDGVKPGLTQCQSHLDAYDRLLLLEGKVEFLKHLTSAQKAHAELDDAHLSEEEDDEDENVDVGADSSSDSDDSEKDEADLDFDDSKI